MGDVSMYVNVRTYVCMQLHTQTQREGEKECRTSLSDLTLLYMPVHFPTWTLAATVQVK